MAKTGRWTTGWVARVALMTVTPAAADERPAVVVLRICNSAEVPPATLSTALNHASRLFDAIGVTLVAVNAGAPAPQVAAQSRELAVVLVSRFKDDDMAKRAGVRKSVLGVAPRDTGRVYLFLGRIARLASSQMTHADIGTVLGRVLAHELGHAMMPGQGHSEAGIMSAMLDYADARAPQFAEAQGAAIRGLLIAAR